MSSTKDLKVKKIRRLRRRRHVRSRIFGTKDAPRLTVFRSHRHIYCQIVDDERGVTLASASTGNLDAFARGKAFAGNARAAAEVGKVIAEKALAGGIQAVKFDRNGYRYHGRVKALAEAARKGGLKF